MNPVPSIRKSIDKAMLLVDEGGHLCKLAANFETQAPCWKAQDMPNCTNYRSLLQPQLTTKILPRAGHKPPSCPPYIKEATQSPMQIGEAGAIPLLVPLVSSEAEEGQDCAVGALANLAVNPRCRQLIADAHGIPPLVHLLSANGVGEGVREIAVGTLTNLAILPANQVLFAAVTRCMQSGMHGAGSPPSRGSCVPCWVT